MVYLQNRHEHVQHISDVLASIRKEKLRLNEKKCAFGVRKNRLWAIGYLETALIQNVERSRPYAPGLHQGQEETYNRFWD
jgi:hypothetical protein